MDEVKFKPAVSPIGDLYESTHTPRKTNEQPGTTAISVLPSRFHVVSVEIFTFLHMWS
jgi:hypothetical protein